MEGPGRDRQVGAADRAARARRQPAAGARRALLGARARVRLRRRAPALRGRGGRGPRPRAGRRGRDRGAALRGSAAGGRRRGAASFAVLHGLYWLTLNLAAERPLLLAVDDLHWCDRPSLRFLAYLARRLDGAPVLAAATLRSGGAGHRPGAPGRDRPRPRRHAAAAGPARRRARSPRSCAPSSADAAEPAFCAACHDATGGNPLLLRQLLRTLEAEGIAPGAANVEAVRAVGPRAVASTVLLRLARLPADAAAVTRAVGRARARAPTCRRSRRSRASARRRWRARRARSSAPRSCARSRRSASSTRSCATPSTTSSRPPSARCSTSAPRTSCASTARRAEQVAAQLLMAPRRGAAWVAELLQAAGEAAVRDVARTSRRSPISPARSRSRRRPSATTRCCSRSARPRR